MSARKLTLLLLPLLAGCGGRPDVWDDAPARARTQVVGLANAVALVDDVSHRAVMLLPREDQRLDRVALPVGKGVIRLQASPDRRRLFVLAGGDIPRRSERDERPSLTVIDASTSVPSSKRFTLAAPRSGLAVDPKGRWLAVYAATDVTTTFVENPNELVLVDLEPPPGAEPVVTTTLRSFGGRPQRLTFAPTLTLPEGPRRLLVVESDQDVTLLDLDHQHDAEPRPEITVRLTGGGASKSLRPAGVVFHDGAPDRDDDARVGLRLENDPSVITLELARSSGTPNDFVPKINLTDVGGVPSDLAFVATDGGIRLAALVPSRSSAVLVEGETSMTTEVKLPAPYRRLSVITDLVHSPTDVALLWNAAGSTGSVAFWALGKTAGQPYRSVDVLDLGASSNGVTNVLDVPPPRPELKVLETGSRGLFVLDLAERTAAPLTTLGAAKVLIAPDAERMWAFQPGETRLSAIDLRRLHPTPLVVDRGVQSVHDVARADGGRSLVAIHETGAYGATVFDARSPDTAYSRLYTGLLLEELQ